MPYARLVRSSGQILARPAHMEVRRQYMLSEALYEHDSRYEISVNIAGSGFNPCGVGGLAPWNHRAFEPEDRRKVGEPAETADFPHEIIMQIRQEHLHDVDIRQLRKQFCITGSLGWHVELQSSGGSMHHRDPTACVMQPPLSLVAL